MMSSSLRDLKAFVGEVKGELKEDESTKQTDVINGLRSCYNHVTSCCTIRNPEGRRILNSGSCFVRRLHHIPNNLKVNLLRQKSIRRTSGVSFYLPCRDKPLKYQLHVSRQRAKKSKNKRNRWQSDWDNVSHRSNSSLPVWELSFAPSEQLSTIHISHISHMPPVTIGAEMLKQHNCVIGF